MKCRIEYAHHRHIRHDLLTGIDPDQVGRIVERRQIVTLFDCSQNLIIQYYRSGEFLTAMYDTVSHRIDLDRKSVV